MHINTEACFAPISLFQSARFLWGLYTGPEEFVSRFYGMAGYARAGKALESKRPFMFDASMLALGIASFVLFLGYAELCVKL